MLQALAFFTIVTGFLLIVALPLALTMQVITCCRDRVWTRNLSLTLVAVAGFLAAGILSWYTLGAGWHLAFFTTIAAAIDSETYGHPVEHAAENLLVAVLFFSVTGCIAAAGTARLLTWKRR